MTSQELIETPPAQKSNSMAVGGGGRLDPSQMIAQALETGAGVEVIERLMALQECWEASQARKGFEAAMARAREKLPKIIKNREVNFNQTRYRYEDLSGVVEQIQPVLAECGLSFRWSTETTDNGRISVSCIVSHREGHQERVTLSGKSDHSGKKNDIQAIGSAITYLQRYTLKAALGLAAAHDDDGRGGPDRRQETISREQKKTLSDLIYRCENSTPKTFCQYFKIATIGELEASLFDHAVRALKKKQSSQQQKGAHHD